LQVFPASAFAISSGVLRALPRQPSFLIDWSHRRHLLTDCAFKVHDAGIFDPQDSTSAKPFCSRVSRSRSA
jgi:hypothetical protein